MRQRFFGILLCGLLLIALGMSSAPACAEQASISQELSAQFDLYQFAEGHVTFAFPGKPKVVSQGASKNLFSSRTQMFLRIDDGEYIVEIADITPLLDYLRADRPDLLKTDSLETTAIMSYVNSIIRGFGGEISEAESTIYEKENRSYPNAQFIYEYSDMPGVTYCGWVVLDDTKLVAVMGTKDDTFQAMVDRFQIMTDAQMEAFSAVKPETCTLGQVSAVFPCETVENVYTPSEKQTTYSLEAFTPGRTYMRLEYLRAGLDLKEFTPEEEMKKSMEKLAKRMGLAYCAGETMEHVVIKEEAADVYSIAFDYESTVEFVGHYVCKQYVSKEGVYVLLADDTEEGRAFIDNAVYKP